jgi:hypothetical protein
MTHSDIKDPILRNIFARELWVLRGVERRIGEKNFQHFQSPWMSGIILGFETALRRVEQHDTGKSPA